MKRTRLAALALAATTALALTGCTNASDSESSSGSTAGGSQATTMPSFDPSTIQKQDDIAALLPDSVSSDGVLTVGASTDYAPAEFRDPDGKPVGYDVDLSAAIAAVLGLTSTVEHAEFDSIIPAVGSKYDVGISSFTITAEREQTVSMVSYINVGSQFNVAAGNPEDIDPSDTLNLCGLSVGVQTGTAQADALSTYSSDCTTAGKDAIDVKYFDTQSNAMTALAGGTLDATFSDSTVAGYAQIQTGGAVETIGDVIDASPQGIVVAKDDQATTEAIQKAVQYLMDSGVWDAILESWSVDTSQALTTAEINPQV